MVTNIDLDEALVESTLRLIGKRTRRTPMTAAPHRSPRRQGETLPTVHTINA